MKNSGKLTDKTAYGRAFGKALLIAAIALLLSGILGLLCKSDVIAILAVAVFLIGLGVGVGCIVAVQRKYNKGVF